MKDYIVVLTSRGGLLAAFKLTANNEEAAKIKAVAAYNEMEEDDVDLDCLGDDALHVILERELEDLG